MPCELFLVVLERGLGVVGDEAHMGCEKEKGVAMTGFGKYNK